MTMDIKPYGIYQQMYNSLVTEHSDDFALMEIVVEEELVMNALKYFEAATFPIIYPAKSYAVALIYAYTLRDIYGLDIYETLRDPDLFLGQDEYYATYDQDPATYDAIISKLQDIPDWITKGWAPKTVSYCLLECTEDGVLSLQ